MYRTFMPIFVVILVCAGMCHLSGCKSPDQTAAVMAALQQGHAAGELTLTTGGKMAAGLDHAFYLGAKDAALTFSGRIDFTPQVTDVLPWPAHGETDEVEED